MTVIKKAHLKCFHHRIHDGHGHIDRDQFLNIDPFDQLKFKRLYKEVKQVSEKKKD